MKDLLFWLFIASIVATMFAGVMAIVESKRLARPVRESERHPWYGVLMDVN